MNIYEIRWVGTGNRMKLGEGDREMSFPWPECNSDEYDMGNFAATQSVV